MNKVPGTETFPTGQWQVDIRNRPAIRVNGSDLHPKSYGLFVWHRATKSTELRCTFVPWHNVNRFDMVSLEEDYSDSSNGE